MSEQHFTEEEIREAAGTAPRDPAGTPKASCLGCGIEYTPHYASRAHECLLDLGDRRTYAEWLLLFQDWGWGVIKTPQDRKFSSFDREISGRQALTEHLQSDLLIGTGTELLQHYNQPAFVDAGFSV